MGRGFEVFAEFDGREDRIHMNAGEKEAGYISKIDKKTQNKKTKQILPPSYDKEEQWVQNYIEQFGEEPGFF